MKGTLLRPLPQLGLGFLPCQLHLRVFFLRGPRALERGSGCRPAGNRGRGLKYPEKNAHISSEIAPIEGRGLEFHLMGVLSVDRPRTRRLRPRLPSSCEVGRMPWRRLRSARLTRPCSWPLPFARVGPRHYCGYLKYKKIERCLGAEICFTSIKKQLCS